MLGNAAQHRCVPLGDPQHPGPAAQCPTSFVVSTLRTSLPWGWLDVNLKEGHPGQKQHLWAEGQRSQLADSFVLGT